MEAMLSPPNAILFVLDPANTSIVVPEYEPGVLTANSGSCLSIATQAEVDGDVTVRLSDQLSSAEKSGCDEFFEGEIATPGRKVAVVTSHFEEVLVLNVEQTVTRVAVGADHPDSPSLIWIEVASSTRPERSQSRDSGSP